MKISNKALKQIILEEVQHVLFEELSGSDKKEIKQIAKKEIESQIKSFIKDEFQKEFQKNLKDRDGRDQIADISKKVLKKFYKEIAFSYPQFIDRMTI